MSESRFGTASKDPLNPLGSGSVKNIVKKIEDSLSQRSCTTTSKVLRKYNWPLTRNLDKVKPTGALQVEPLPPSGKPVLSVDIGSSRKGPNDTQLPRYKASGWGGGIQNGHVVKNLLEKMHSSDSAPNLGDRITSRHHGVNIKQKILQWEGKTNVVSSMDKPTEGTLSPDHACSFASNAKTESLVGNNKRGLVKAKSLGLDFREGWNAGDQKVKSTEKNGGEPNSRVLSSVFPQAKKLENLAKNSPDSAKLLPPGNFYTSQKFWKKMQDIPQDQNALSASELKRKRESSSSTEKDLDLSTFKSRETGTRNAENVYSTDSEETEESRGINPVPKPRRTFKYAVDKSSGDSAPQVKGISTKENVQSAPPLPTHPPPSAKIPGTEAQLIKTKRKSYEFEDVDGLKLLLTPAGHAKNHEQGGKDTEKTLPQTLSEENIYEDIISPSKENPYEDVKFTPTFLSRGRRVWASPPSRPRRPPELPPKPPGLLGQAQESKTLKVADQRKVGKDCTVPLLRSSPLSVPGNPEDSVGGDVFVKKRKKIPMLVSKIQAVYNAKRGKKKVKALTSTGPESTPQKDENSETESDTEEQQKAHSQRLVYVHSTLKRNTRYQTLERDLIELQEQQLFEYFVVVSLRKKVPSNTYEPQVTQQFPSKLEKSTRQARDAEERLKAIPQFCFPDISEWAAVSHLISETFSFVLTGEDGSRRFGYCRKLLPNGKGKRLPEVYCIISRLGCFNLFSKILDEVEKRRELSPALVHPFMRSVMEAPFPAPGRVITVKNFLPGSGNEVIELCRPTDSRLEHVDFECLFGCLNVRHVVHVFASLLLERRVIFIADKLSTLSKCGHAAVAMLYPFTWQHTYIPVLPAVMIDIACSPTPFLIGILSNSVPLLNDLPIEEVLVVDLCADRFLRRMDDEDSILPHKLQAALVHIFEQKNEMLASEEEAEGGDAQNSLSTLVSEACVRFFVEIAGHYSLHMSVNEKGERSFQRDAFRKSHTSKSIRQFLELFMETQMFAGFVQDRELRKSGVKGLFEVRAGEYLETIPETGPSSVNRFLKGLGNKMKFLSKK
ncbi:DENN domain-containing protein 2C-like [Pristis pectinata]|uniref:DENN domain-containing protein 2C-like n=1 Tax=Pristis pectinata TaxID=685728 RepID=UPI00223E1633|nr:DENN domain-containing protein 2C-like [Pristis pectinata]XP_051890629.1 DENN domain-containing protein 2C-like [Pristis pectinata]XP_051890630.1 DENN domain-containing protein 2C-like [Pristis pectinata]XP_051890631.1 DENN domain-containing protein 2C-like [Pristis pectinata]XP_051890632.1 DENN domain-containing protein 2C-like [Pristis pectinata]XP_051890633.1 DENN domain-containing protein 2C-like [Pristis pectinata]XP_051890634.1 DENN domain-containing protein 2C-like [Pristis pectinat